MKKINSLESLKAVANSNKNVWLLLYKPGSEQSDCAYENFQKASESSSGKVFFASDVTRVRDIHVEFGVASVPALLHFENGQLRNMVKGCHQSEQFNAIFDKSAAVFTGNSDSKKQKNVIVYTTPTCTWCTTIKRHLQENRIKFREIDVSKDQKAAEEMVKRSGQQGVPQTDINGEIIVGFDKTRINKLLEIH
jgi:glutaredoxin-like YruB-family protein